MQSLEQLESDYETLSSEYREIEVQLGDRNRVDANGRLASEEYWVWRQKAKVALMVKQKQIQKLKKLIKAARVRVNELQIGDMPNATQDEILLLGAYFVMQRWAQRVPPAEDELRLMHSIRDRFIEKRRSIPLGTE